MVAVAPGIAPVGIVNSVVGVMTKVFFFFTDKDDLCWTIMIG